MFDVPLGSLLCGRCNPDAIVSIGFVLSGGQQATVSLSTGPVLSEHQCSIALRGGLIWFCGRHHGARVFGIVQSGVFLRRGFELCDGTTVPRGLFLRVGHCFIPGVSLPDWLVLRGGVSVSLVVSARFVQ